MLAVGAVFLSLFFFFTFISLFLGFYIVQQQTAAIVQRLGKFNRVANPGLNLKIPWLDWVAGRVNLRIQQLDVEVDTKTEDNVFVRVVASVQYFVNPNKVFEAFYKLDSPESQITSFVFDVVRARVPQMTLDSVFEKKDEIADAVKQELSETMDEFGYAILKALVTDINPDEKVKLAMNEINAAQRLRVAATEKGEAEKILRVKEAEADAESKALAGQGIARQRSAIVDGLRESVDEFQKNIAGATAQDVMSLVLMTQYFDTLQAIGSTSQTNTILIPHSPGHMSELTDQIRNAIISANQVPSERAKR